MRRCKYFVEYSDGHRDTLRIAAQNFERVNGYPVKIINRDGFAFAKPIAIHRDKGVCIGKIVSCIKRH